MEVARGRSGYGFTLSGHSPCVLSCVLTGSPAHHVGLRTGDRVLAVNDVDVARASHEDVVKLIGRCQGVLRLLTTRTAHTDSCSSDEELVSPQHKGHWTRPKMDSKTLGINRAERVVADMQSGGIFNMIFQSHAPRGSDQVRPHPYSHFPGHDPDLPGNDPDLSGTCRDLDFPDEDPIFLGEHLSEQELSRLDPEASAAIVSVGMIVGYLGSIELASSGASLESASLQAMRGCMRRLRAEQKVHSLVLLQVLTDRVTLRNERGIVLAVYPAHKLAFSAVCPDDRRLFGLVTMQEEGQEEEGGARTSCHVFLVDPELCHHKVLL